MTLKTTKFISCIVTFGLAFLTHYIYQWFPNTLTSIFFPVNESIWEHMKMLYTTILLGEIINYFLIKKFNIKTNNFLLSVFIKATISIPIFLSIYLPIYYLIGEYIFITLSIMFITLIIVEVISYYILKIKTIKYNSIISLIIIIISYTIFAILTFYPPSTNLFYDQKNHCYGINIYDI